jgi:hypothetical protein
MARDKRITPLGVNNVPNLGANFIQTCRCRQFKYGKRGAEKNAQAQHEQRS